MPDGAGPGDAPGAPAAPDRRTTVVVATRDRRCELLATIRRLLELPEAPAVIVVDNASTDGSAAAVRAAFPADRVDVVALDRNLAAAGRNVGVRRAATPYVAFADDDSWWAPGALRRAADALDAHPRLAVAAARVLVGADERLDPASAEMAASPLPADGLPGPAVLGFLACGAVVRRRAFLEVGGFDDLLGIMGEEGLLAVDLARGGWALAYLDDVVAHHHPSPARDPRGRRRLQARNELLVAWMRRPAGVAVGRTAAVARAARRGDREAAAVRAAAGRRLPGALRRRRPNPPDVEVHVRRLERPA